ncbi:MAG: acyl dehydratase, partial [Chloroflexi bacterium]|nr:acyl dehydratase [Chloroflexota bacterium]
MTTTLKQVYWEDIQEGQALPEMRRRPGNTQLFLVSAIDGNPHRIHYDKDWAAYEGYPDLVIQGPLHGNYMARLIVNWMGFQGSLKRFGYSNRAMAFNGDELVIKAQVKRKWEEDGL